MLDCHHLHGPETERASAALAGAPEIFGTGPTGGNDLWRTPPSFHLPFRVGEPVPLFSARPSTSQPAVGQDPKANINPADEPDVARVDCNLHGQVVLKVWSHNYLQGRQLGGLGLADGRTDF